MNKLYNSFAFYLKIVITFVSVQRVVPKFVIT